MMSAMHARRQSAGFSLVELLLALTLMSMLLALAYGGLRASTQATEKGQKILDVGCGFGETTIEMGQMVGPEGEVVGLDCTQEFLDIADKERKEAGLENVRFDTGDAQTCDLR